MRDTVQKKGKSLGTLTIGGYGEAVYKYNFFSDNVFRYSHAANYADSKGHGRVDLPHAVIMLGYDFGHGWSFNTEIEFEHGGTESAVEVEAEETGEFEKEIERGGEVGYDVFHHHKNPKMDRHKLYLFARYEYYDSYIPGHNMIDYAWTDRHCVSDGLNYSPIKEIVIKAEAGVRLLKSQYNQEPWCALGITWAGMFSKEFHKKG